MSRKVQMICESCNCLYWVNRQDEYAKCPKCGWLADIEEDGFSDQIREDE